jgi:hypothetical protein
MLFLILIGIVFLLLIGIQVFFWCQVIKGFVIHYKFRKVFGTLVPLLEPQMQKNAEDEKDMKGYQ